MGVGLPDIDTPLFVDMYIATKLLHRTHQEFLDLPRIEKKKLKLFIHVQSEKRIKEKQEMDKPRTTSSSPRTRIPPRRR